MSATGHEQRSIIADAKSGLPSIPDQPQATKLVALGPIAGVPKADFGGRLDGLQTIRLAHNL